eukprot:1212795-Rhodomonas_salina.1
MSAALSRKPPSHNQTLLDSDASGRGMAQDQRENRHRLGQLCAGKEVLDTFCYSGGFSINAALAGAT